MVSEYALLAVAAVAAVAVLVAAAIGVGYLLWLGERLFAIPGIVVHEFAHKRACDLVGVTVVEVVYFRLGDPAGYVRHEQPARYRDTFVISVAPFLVNTLIAFTVFLALAALVETIGDPGTTPAWSIATGIGLAWFGLSIGVSAFPSTGDANTLWTRSRSEWRRSPIVLLGIPVVVVIYVVNLLSWLWADLFYAVGLLLCASWLVGIGPI
ncbi:metalloprotease family protein [Halosolutus halophilus]|uniref:metalloprotease family protein n=1 Tax=Halosolutus halophilus TaxID=1552990 RepID=UPI002234EDE5|nr:metalloprotease family protein [Halosolutus halophilus]